MVFLHPGCCSGCAGPTRWIPVSVLFAATYVHAEDFTVGAAHACPPTACLGLGCPQGSPGRSLCCFVHRGLWVFYFLLWPPQTLPVLLCLHDTHTPVPVLHGPAGPLHSLGPAGFAHLGTVESLPFRKPSNFILELVLKLIAAQSLTAVLISDLKLLDLVTPSSLGRSVFIIIVSKEGLGDY